MIFSYPLPAPKAPPQSANANIVVLYLSYSTDWVSSFKAFGCNSIISSPKEYVVLTTCIAQEHLIHKASCTVALLLRKRNTLGLGVYSFYNKTGFFASIIFTLI